MLHFFEIVIFFVLVACLLVLSYVHVHHKSDLHLHLHFLHDISVSRHVNAASRKSLQTKRSLSQNQRTILSENLRK